MHQASNTQSPPQKRISKSRPTPEQKAAFYVAIGNGVSASQAARIVGVSQPTGLKWAKQHRLGKAEQEARGLTLVSKTELAEIQSKLLRNAEVDPRDIVAAGKAYAELMGFNEATRTLNVHISADMEGWLAMTYRRESAALAPARAAIDAGGEPQMQKAANALSPSPNISQNSTKAPNA